MKKKKSIRFILFPVVLITGMYIVFYSRIESKPNHAGFWFIFILGMSVGVSLTLFMQWLKEKNRK